MNITTILQLPLVSPITNILNENLTETDYSNAFSFVFKSLLQAILWVMKNFFFYLQVPSIMLSCSS